MAIGNTYNNNSQINKKYSPTVYSPYRFNNAESNIEQTCLTFTFWKSTLKISICPKKPSDDPSVVSFDYQNGISIYLNHTKARIFANELKNFLQDNETYNGAGVSSGNNLIIVTTGKEYGSNSPMIIIHHLDDNGHPTSTFGYQVKTNFHYSLRNYINNGDGCVKITKDYDNIEIEQIITILEEYYRSMTYSTAFSIMDAASLDNNTHEILSNVASKLGIDTNSGGYGRSYNNANNYFNNMPGNSNGSISTPTQYQPASLDDFLSGD